MNQQKGPKFLRKLYEILKDEQFDFIRWNHDGDAFQINNVNSLVKLVLSVQFKQSSFFSFVRQLNQYGFQKQKIEKDQYIFRHKNFLRDQIELLQNIVSSHKIRSLKYKLEQREKIIDSDELDQQTIIIQELQQKQKQICDKFKDQVQIQLQLKQKICYLKNQILEINLSLEQKCFIAQMLLVKVMNTIPNDEDHQFEIELISKVIQEFSNIYLEYYCINQSQRSPNLFKSLTPLPFQNEQQRKQIAFLDQNKDTLQCQLQSYLKWVKESYEMALLKNSV